MEQGNGCETVKRTDMIFDRVSMTRRTGSSRSPERFRLEHKVVPQYPESGVFFTDYTV